MDMVRLGEPLRSRSCLPFRRFPLRSLWTPLCRSLRRLSPNTRQYRHLHCSHDEHLHRRHGHCRCWSGYQRVDISRRCIRIGPEKKARNLRGCLDLHHSSILPKCALWPIDCIKRHMEICWSLLRRMGFHWSRSHGHLLSSTTTRADRWHVPPRGTQARRLYWRFLVNHRSSAVHGWNPVGRLPVRLVERTRTRSHAHWPCTIRGLLYL